MRPPNHPEPGSTPVARALSSWHRAYLAVSLLLLGLSIVVAATGGLQWKTPWLTISVTRGWRLATIAFAVWLVGVTWDRPSRHRWLVLLPLAGVLLSAAADGQPQRVGDSHEYVAMARGVSAFDGPARPEAAIRASMRTDWNTPAPEFPLVVPSLQGSDGRFDFPHFWFYPALAAPLVPLADAAGVHVRWAFFAVNLAVLLVAAALLAVRLSPAAVLLLACGPVVWWIDKAHTEVFTWSLLTVALSALDTAPAWSLVALGAAATQNPPFTVVLVLTLLWVVLVKGQRTPAVWGGFAAGAALAAIAPLYYRHRLGIWSALSVGAVPHWPSWAELTAVLSDPNVGIIPAAPAFFALLVAAIYLAAREWRTARWSSDGWHALVLAAVLLASFSQAVNVNSGGTPNPSRYGVWLTALLVPAAISVQRARSVLPRVLATFGLAWSLVIFHPHLGDHYLRPTALASWLWDRWPSADNPLPEIFCERLTGSEGVQELPVATPRCSKVLLAAGPRGVDWPAGCPGGDVPERCRVLGALCYANRAGQGWRFAEAPRQAAFRYRVRPSREPSASVDGDARLSR